MSHEHKVKRVRREEIRREKRGSSKYRRAYNREFRASLWDYANLVPCFILEGFLAIVTIICLIGAILTLFKGHIIGGTILLGLATAAAITAVSVYAKVIHGQWIDCCNAAHKAGLKAKNGTKDASSESDDDDEAEEDESPTTGAALGSDIMAACMGAGNQH